MKLQLTLLLIILLFSSCNNSEQEKIKEATNQTEDSIGMNKMDSIRLYRYYNIVKSSFDEDTSETYGDNSDLLIYRIYIIPSSDKPYLIETKFNPNIKFYKYKEEERQPYDSIYFLSIKYKELYGLGGYGFGPVSSGIQTYLPLTDTLIKNNWEGIQNKIEEINFWNQPKDKYTSMGTDGIKFIIEGYYKGNKHFIVRHGGSFGRNYHNYPDDYKRKEIEELLNFMTHLIQFGSWNQEIEKTIERFKKEHSRQHGT